MLTQYLRGLRVKFGVQFRRGFLRLRRALSRGSWGSRRRAPRRCTFLKTTTNGFCLYAVKASVSKGRVWSSWSKIFSAFKIFLRFAIISAFLFKSFRSTFGMCKLLIKIYYNLKALRSKKLRWII